MVSDVQMSRAIDTVLDRTIALGDGDAGRQVRRQLCSLAERSTIVEKRLDVLVTNAGPVPDQRERSPDRRARPTHYRLGASGDESRARCRLWNTYQSLIGR